MFIFFWICFILGLCFAVLAILCQNTVYSILVLILLFITAAALLFLLNVEFLGFIFIIVYVGAIAVLFLFVVMLLNIRVQEVHTSVMRYWPWGGLFGFSCLALLLLVFSFDLPAGYTQVGVLGSSFIGVFDSACAFFSFLFKGLSFAFLDVLSSTSEISGNKLFYFSFAHNLGVFLRDVLFDTVLVQFVWFNLCSIWLAAADVLVYQDMHNFSVSWFGKTPNQFAYPIFCLLCVRDYFVAFYSILAHIIFTFGGVLADFGPISQGFIRVFRNVLLSSLPVYAPWFSVFQQSFVAPGISDLSQLIAMVSFLPKGILPLTLFSPHFPTGGFLPAPWVTFTFEVDLLTLLGRALYEPFVAYFLTAGLILFIALIGALVLTYKRDTSRKRMYLLRQVNGETKRLLLRIPGNVSATTVTQRSRTTTL